MPQAGTMMIYLVAILTILTAISYQVYLSAKTEALGFKALVAWLLFGALDIAALVGWGIWALLQAGT